MCDHPNDDYDGSTPMGSLLRTRHEAKVRLLRLAILKQSNELSPSTQNVVPQIPEGLEAYAYGNVNQYGINMNFTAMGVYTGEDIMNQAINGFVNPYGGYQGYY